MMTRCSDDIAHIYVFQACQFLGKWHQCPLFNPTLCNLLGAAVDIIKEYRHAASLPPLHEFLSGKELLLYQDVISQFYL